jgi:enoyl-CoA hydratase
VSESAKPAATWTYADNGIMTVTLRHPPVNPLGPPIIDGLGAALDAADEVGDVKIVILESGIPGFFAAGADIKHMSADDADSFVAYGNSLRNALDRLASADRITIAVVEGLALGGGLELAMACTLRVAGDAAKFGLPEVNLGLIPGAGGTQRLPRLVGRGRALDIMLTARQVPALEAYGIGLVDRLVPAGGADAAALALANELSTKSLPAQQAVIRTIDAAFDMTLDMGLRYEVAQIQDLFERGEAKEGITAFLGKRPPNFA